MKRLAVLGSTGSIGLNTLKVARHLGESIQIKAIAAHSSIDLLEEQAKQFQPEIVAVCDKEKARELQSRLPNANVVGGMEGVIEAATWDGVDMVISAMSGTQGLIPTVRALEAGRDIGLANKEALVSGGALVTRLAKEKGASIIPIDSEHSAIFQCLQGEKPAKIRRIVLTASGGPFREYSFDQLLAVTAADALKHPTWSMGPKVTVDSSTLMNKGLEVIEVRWLFDLPAEKIHVVVHPQSVIHSMVEYVDNSMIAQMSRPSMVLPIQYAITYPERHASPLEPFDFLEYPSLTFGLPDTNRFPCLRLAFDAMREGGSLPCYMNAANQVLVERFLDGQIAWLDIAKKLESLMDRHRVKHDLDLDGIVAVDKRARAEAQYE